MSTGRVVSQVLDDVVQNQFETLESVQRRAEQIMQDVRPAHGDDAGGNRDPLPGALTGMSEGPLQGRGAQARPQGPRMTLTPTPGLYSARYRTSECFLNFLCTDKLEFIDIPLVGKSSLNIRDREPT